MNRLSLCTAAIAVGAVVITQPLLAKTVTVAEQDEATAQFVLSHGQADVMHAESGELSRVYGKALATGKSPEASAQAFVDASLTMLGVEGADIVPADRGGQGSVQPVMYQSDSDTYKFFAVYYDQIRDGVPVHGARLTVLVRNEPGFPVVLVNTDVRNLGDFHPDLLRNNQDLADLSDAIAMAQFQILSTAGHDAPHVYSSRSIIWTGEEGSPERPRLAREIVIDNEVDSWLIIVEAATGAVLYENHRICFADIEGNVSGMSTEGFATAECNVEVARPMPYLELTASAETVFTDVDGNYEFNDQTGFPVTVDGDINGLWFEIFDFIGSVESLSSPATPPAIIDLLFNATNSSELIRAQVNAYIEANVVRDMAFAANPAYPTLNNGSFPVTVNRDDGFCPSNAWYSPTEQSINFCSSAGSSNPNTAWSSVIHHEYGHHLVNAGGSGQGQYGEGMGDVMSTIILDSPRLGAGWGGNCSGELRNADNTLQYPCSGAIHTCGQLISGCVWSTRNELIITEPANYQSILSDLAVNSILLHSGDLIAPSITIDWLTLDDNDGNIFNGTPHYQEIATGFGAHNMDAPELSLLDIQFPDGTLDSYDPNGGTTMRVVVVGISATPQPDSGVLVLDTGSGFVNIPMTQTAPNEYDAIFPATLCGTFAAYRVSAETAGGSSVTFPFDGSNLDALAGFGTIQHFIDDFETNMGWTVASAGGLTDGAWQRGTPVGGGDRGDPPFDADGSGQCFLTDNVDGNSDVDGGSTILTSPVMDASGGASLLSYHRWYSNTFGGSPEADIFRVEVSDDAGGSWSTLETVGPGGPEVDGGWFLVQFDLSDLPGFTPNDQFRVRFTASDLGEGSVVEAGIDSVELLEVDCSDPGITEDLDGDGQVGFGDLVLLLAAWGPCPGCDADFDGDGVVGFNDLVQLLGAWTN